MRRLAAQTPGALEQEIERLRAENDRLRNYRRETQVDYRRLCKRLSEAADVPLLVHWIRNSREPSITAFTSGPEREVAFQIERYFTRKRRKKS